MINANKPEKWKTDIVASIDHYNTWFMRFAPEAYRTTRQHTTQQVLDTFQMTNNLNDLSLTSIKRHPAMLQILRMATAPPIARDRLIGLANVSPSLVKNMEQFNRLPPRMRLAEVNRQLDAIFAVLSQLLDDDILFWIGREQTPAPEDVFRAATVIADRLCGAVSDPIIRNAQEERQLSTIANWLNVRGYQLIKSPGVYTRSSMPAGAYAFHVIVPVRQEGRQKNVNMPIDVVIRPKNAARSDFPLLIEAKSAGDFTNTNKRRKEEATKFNQLRYTYGHDVRFILYLCGYFDTGYLGYEAAEGIDWVWEHRIDDLALLGL
ncbi:MAG: XamI family restriction endonuclease [Anaerolineales bacterium]|nr:XamI family restriction endonuclease [Anaerolineales bacterium]